MPNARDVMTPDPACCTPRTTLDEVARLMAQHQCGEIPVIGTSDRVLGVITDRDIVCRVVAEGKNPAGHTVERCMTQPAITVRVDDPLERVVSIMNKFGIRRVPVVDELGSCAGIIARPSVARVAEPLTPAELMRLAVPLEI